MEKQSYRERVNQLGMRDLTPKLWGIIALLVGLAVLMATALYMGIDPDGTNRVSTLINGLLGRGDIKSLFWLWVSRLSVVALVFAVIWARREQSALADEVIARRARESEAAE